MKIKDIFNNVNIIESVGNLDTEINNISSDSRVIEKNDMFFAIKGYDLDGTKFINSAVQNGASAIVIDETCNIADYKVPESVIILKVPNIRHTLAVASCNLYDNPSKKLKLIGVTGTKGKTTSTYMIKSILQKHGLKVGLIGSIAIYINDEKIEDCDRTTAESYKIQKT